MSKIIRCLLALSLAALVAGPAFAGGPLANCQPGVPFVWPNGGANIPFNPDQGDLGPLTGAQAVQLTQDSFDVWGAVSTATVSYTNAGLLPVDVDITNFGPFLNPVAPDGLSAIVFDDDGAIFNLLFGPGSGILGFAGPEWLNGANCTILEGVSFLNGPSFTNLTAAFDVMVHEFGHYTNLAHTVVNGQIYLGSVGGDNSGPTPNDPFPIPSPFTDIVETMYPFYYGPGIGTSTLAADDIASVSTLYPAAGFSTSTGSISGTIFAPNGTTKLTGVNVIARNVANPFADAVSAISSDFTDGTAQSDPFVGTYKIEGLTPGADYVVYVDTILAGGFSTTPLVPLPGPEEYSNAAESSDPNVDDPNDATPITVVAGADASGTDVIFNAPGEGDPLPVGDDGSVEIFLPFSFCFCGQSFDSVFINANGNLTFGAPDSDFSESVPEFLNGAPRIAGLWDDLNSSAGGTVSFSTTATSFTVSFADVPEFFATGANSFDITLFDNHRDCDGDSDSDGGHHLGFDDELDNSRHGGSSDHDSDSDSDGGFRHGSDVRIDYGAVSALDGLAGVSCGLFATNGIEPEVDLSSFGNHKISLDSEAAAYEIFTAGDNDLANTTNFYKKVGPGYDDDFEKNNSRSRAKTVKLPFNTLNTKKSFSSIDPAAADVDYYKIRNLGAGQTLIAEVVRGQIDSVMGIFDAQGNLLNNPAADDDAGTGLLSRSVVTLPANGTYYVAVSFCCDYDLDGVDPGQGGPLDVGRYVLDVVVVDGTPITLGDDSSELVTFGFNFPFNGTNYNSVFVNSNGNLTFNSGDSDFSESVPELLNGNPRIAPLWDDLSPNAGGLVLVKENANSLKVTFSGVPQFFTADSNNFAVTLSSSGAVTVEYGAVSADAIAGVTEGGFAADPGPTDLSAAGALSAVGTTYEQFVTPADLSGVTLNYAP